MSSSITSEDMSISPSSSSTSTVSLSDNITPPPSYITNTALPGHKSLDQDIEMAARPSNIPGAEPLDQDIELAAPARPKYETSDERLSRYRIELATAKENLVDSEYALRKQKVEIEAQRREVRLVEKLIADEQWRKGPPFRMIFSELCLFLGRFLTAMTVMAPLLGVLAFAMHVDSYHAQYCQTNPKLVGAHVNWIAHFGASLITLWLSASIVVPQVHTRSGESKLFVAGFMVFMSGFCLLVTIGFATIPGDAFNPC